MENAVGIAELAVLLGVSKDTIRRKVENGEIPGFQIGRMWRFHPSAVIEKLSEKADPWARPAASKRAPRKASAA